ncbi:MAG TPA: LTA synthase family protein [Marmoricola sp.]
MPAKSGPRSRALTTAHVLALLVPLGLVDLFCQGWMDHKVFHTTPLDWQAWWTLRSVFLFHVGVGALWLLWLRSDNARRRPRLAYACLHIYFTLMALLVCFNVGFFYYLDIQVESGLLNEVIPMIEAGIWTVIKSAVSPVFIIIGALLIFVANQFPRFMIWVLGIKRRERARAESAAATPQADDTTSTDAVVDSAAPASNRRRTSIVVGLAVVCIVLAWAVPDGLSSTRFTRQRLPELINGIVLNATAKKLPPTPTADLPLNTRLVPTKHAKRYNVVYIVQESQRAKSVSYYSHQYDNTPVFDKLAKTSIVAQHAYTAVPHTSKSLVTSHCGVAPPLDSDNSEGRPNTLSSRCLPRLLEGLGYHTAFFQSPTEDFEHREEMVKNLGFQQFIPLEKMSKKGFYPVNPLGYEDDIMVKPSVDWAKKQKSPFELTYMTVTAHYDYTLPKNFPAKKYVSDPTYNRYLNAVRYQDRFVGKVIQGFKKAGLYKNTIFVVMGDHGEGFREHERRIHNDTIWTEGIHIPLLIRVPGMKKSDVITRPVANTALLPTLAKLMGYKIEGGKYEYAPMTDSTPAQPVITRCWDQEQCISYIDGQHQFIHFFDEQPDAYYDLATDPDEKHNIIDTLSDKTRKHLVTLLHDWVLKVNANYAHKHVQGPPTTAPTGSQ